MSITWVKTQPYASIERKIVYSKSHQINNRTQDPLLIQLSDKENNKTLIDQATKT